MKQRLRNLNMLKLCAWPSERADLTALSAWHRAAWLLDPQFSSRSTDFGLMPFQLIAAAIWLGYDWDWKISVGSAVRCKAVRGSEHRDERLDQTILVRLTKKHSKDTGPRGSRSRFDATSYQVLLCSGSCCHSGLGTLRLLGKLPREMVLKLYNIIHLIILISYNHILIYTYINIIPRKRTFHFLLVLKSFWVTCAFSSRVKTLYNPFVDLWCIS